MRDRRTIMDEPRRKFQIHGIVQRFARVLSRKSDVVLISHQQLGEEKNQAAICIIDEAHNLPELLAQMYTAEVDCADTVQIVFQLDEYLNTHRQILSSQHIICVEAVRNQLVQLLRMAGSLVENSTVALSCQELGASLKRFSLHRQIFSELHTFREQRFVHRARRTEAEHPMYQHLDLLELLCNSDVLENFLLTQSEGGGHPAALVPEFQKMFDASTTKTRYASVWSKKLSLAHLAPKISLEYKNITCVGGTITPFASFLRIFPPQKQSFKTLQVGHVIAPSQLRLSIVTSVGGRPLRLTHEEQQRAETLRVIVERILQARRELPSGQNVIAFFPSYSLAKRCAEIAEQSAGVAVSTFQQQRDGAAINVTLEVPKTPLDFITSRIKTLQSHVLFAAATATLAEGIDFKDDACRALFVVGVPFPNVRDAYVAEKSRLDPGYAVEKAFRAVNQCAGRAIRWRGDWASVVLVDGRYVDQAANLSPWLLAGGFQSLSW